MASNRIATRYAKSLIDQGLEAGIIDTLFDDAKSFLAVSDHREFRMMLNSPVINTFRKQAIFDELFKSKFSTLSLNFFKVILRKNREAILPDIMDSFIELYDELKKRSQIKISSASKLTENQLESLKDKIIQSKVTHPNLEVKTVVDPTLIGGFTLDIGDAKYDASVKSKLDSIRKEFSN